MKRFPLKMQYICGICGLIFVVSMLLLLYVRSQFNRQLDNELHKRGISIARNLADATIIPILTENHVALQLLVNDMKKNEEDIAYIYVISRQGEIIAHTFGRAFPTDLLKLDHPDMKGVAPLIQALEIENRSMEDIAVTIQQGNFGRVHIGVTEEMIIAEQNDLYVRSAPFAGLILLLGIAAGWWFASKVTRPIIALSNSAKLVTEGQLDAIIAVTSNDELGELSATFNTMISELKEKTGLQHQTETELRRQAELLEAEVARRQIIQEELSDKQCQLEGLNRQLEDRVTTALEELRVKDRVMLAQGRQAAMGEMINNIAHQWRQPLNNLGLIVQNIEIDYDNGSLTPERLTDYVSKVMSTIMFMSQTINDFSNFFSPDSTRNVFTVSSSLKKVIAMIEASLSKLGIRLIVEQQEEGVAIEGYFNEYNQVILNLFNNSKDALRMQEVEHPEITVSISLENGQAVVRMRDNAGGIPEEIIGRIFDHYFTTKEHGKGSGIGLYMSRTIIEDHFGGTITASNVDGGALFTVSVPCVQKTGAPLENERSTL